MLPLCIFYCVKSKYGYETVYAAGKYFQYATGIYYSLSIVFICGYLRCRYVFLENRFLPSGLSYSSWLRRRRPQGPHH